MTTILLCAASFALGHYAGAPILAGLSRVSEVLGEWIVARWSK